MESDVSISTRTRDLPSRRGRLAAAGPLSSAAQRLCVCLHFGYSEQPRKGPYLPVRAAIVPLPHALQTAPTAGSGGGGK